MESPEKTGRVNMSYAPVKKRIHTDMSAIVIGTARKALFSPKKRKQSGILADQIDSAQSAECDAEIVHETSPVRLLDSNQRLLRLQIASLIYDNISSFSASQLVSSSKLKKKVEVTTNMSKKQYLLVFEMLGKSRDLTRQIVPPEDVFDYFCMVSKQSDKKGKSASRATLQTRWSQFNSEEKKKYEVLLENAKVLYNRILEKEAEDKKSGTEIPLYEERIISNLTEFEGFLGPLSLRRSYAGYRTVAGQIPVVIEVCSPIRLIYDETDHSLSMVFYIAPKV